MTAIMPSTGTLGAETSDCALAGLDLIDPRATMTAGLVGSDPAKAAFGSMAALHVSIACLNDEEWEKAASAAGLSDQDRAGGQCLMAELGGPRKYAEALMRTREEDFTALAQAGPKCRVGIGMPRQPPATPRPTAIPTPSQTGTTPPATLAITAA